MRAMLFPLVLASLAMTVLSACGSLAPTFSLEVTLDGTGAGTVVSDPAGIDTADGTFEADFAHTTAVTLTATPDAGSTFDGFTLPAGVNYTCEDGSGADTCIVTMNYAKSVGATFDSSPDLSTLTVGINAGGSAKGTVTSDPAGIDTGSVATGTFSDDFTIGSTVELTATADAGGFYGWTGGDCDGLNTATCTVTVGDAEPQVTALFNDVVTIDVQVGASGGDAEEFLEDSADDPGSFPDGFVWATSTSLELAYDAGVNAVHQSLGFRFANVTVPADAVVLDASLVFTAFNRLPEADFGTGTTGDVPLTISGEAAANPGGFANGVSSDITLRTRTSTTAAWTISGAWIGETEYPSEDMAAIVQEILGTSGWTSGNAMVFFLDGDVSTEEYRRAYSYDEDPAKAPAMTIEYVVAPTP